MSNVTPTKPTKPKTTPDRAWFCRKAVGVGVVEWVKMIVDVWVRVCCTTEGEEVVEVPVEVDEVVDEVVEIDVLVLFETEKLADISK